MNTNTWGPGAWLFLEALCFNYPEDPKSADEERYRQFLGELMPSILCCKYCRISTEQFVKTLPIEPYLVNRPALVVWIYLLHDKVNQKLSKQSITFRQFVHKYEKIRAKCSKEKKGCVIKSPQKAETEISAWADLAYQRYGTRNYLISQIEKKQRKDLFKLYCAVAIAILIVFVTLSARRP